MKENLTDSLTVAHKLSRACTVVTEMMEKIIKKHPDLNDELSLLVAGVYNGLSNIERQVNENMELLRERQDFCGHIGIEKQINVTLDEQEADE